MRADSAFLNARQAESVQGVRREKGKK